MSNYSALKYGALTNRRRGERGNIGPSPLRSSCFKHQAPSPTNTRHFGSAWCFLLVFPIVRAWCFCGSDTPTPCPPPPADVSDDYRMAISLRSGKQKSVFPVAGKHVLFIVGFAGVFLRSKLRLLLLYPETQSLA